MNFARSLVTVSGFTALSRVAGFVRDTLTAIILGAGPVADAFFVAQRLPNLFRSLFAEGAFASAFVPLYTKEKDKNGKQKAQIFAGHALSLLLAVLVPFSVLVIFAMPFVMDIIAPGFVSDPHKYALALDFSKITFAYLALISVTALQTGILNAHGRFGPGAAAPIAFNLVLIAALFLAQIFKWQVGYALAWAVTVSGVVQMIWLGFSCWRAGLSIPLVRPKMTPAIRNLFSNIAPGAVGAGASQINLVISTCLASLLPTGAVSWLYYADRLNQLPLGIIGIAVATTLLPILSHHSKDNSKFLHYTSRGVEFCLLFGLPATIGLAICAQPIIQTLWEHDAFTHADTIATSQALIAYTIGIPASLLVKVFAASFFARNNTRTPVKVALIAMVTNVVGALLLLHPLQHIGIAFANSVATWVNALILFAILYKQNRRIGDALLYHRAPRLLLSALIMGLGTWGLGIMIAPMFAGQSLLRALLGLSLLIGGSGLLYIILLEITKAMPWRDFILTLKRQKQ